MASTIRRGKSGGPDDAHFRDQIRPHRESEKQDWQPEERIWIIFRDGL
jgi:hypothetical protein